MICGCVEEAPGWLLGRSVGSRRARAGEHPAVGAIPTAQRGHERLPVPSAGRLPEGRVDRERQIRAQQGPSATAATSFRVRICPTP